MSFESYLADVWLENIKKLDNKNHLKHGEIYAKDGSVQDFQINDNIVESRVEGAPGDFFNVKIKFKKLSNQEKGKLNKLIKENHQFQTKILNDVIPRELFSGNVKIIPDSLKDFKMSCDCKNKGLFCKHKAAVFLYLSKEIHKNPFLIFTLRDYHFDRILGFAKNKIPSIDYLMDENREFIEHDDVNIDEIPLLINDFKFQLNGHSGFFSSSTVSFKDILIDTLKEFSILIQKINNYYVIHSSYIHYINLGDSLDLKSDLEDIFQKKWHQPQDWKKFRLDIDKNYNIINFETGLPLDFRIKNLNHALFALFAEFKFTDISQYNEDLQFFNELYHVTSRLISKNALIPQFFKLNNGEYAVRWIPSSNKMVSELIDNLACKCPDNLISYQGNDLGKYEQVTVAISLFFKGFSLYASYNSNSSIIRTMKNNIYYQLFFFKSQKFHIKDDERLISNWLAPLCENNNYKFILEVSQKDEMFIITSKVTIDDDTLILKDIIKSGEYPTVIRNSKLITDIFERYGWEVDLTEEIKVDIDDFIVFSSKIVHGFEKNGIDVILPEDLRIAKRAKLSLISDEKTLSKTSLTLEDLNKFNWKVAIGDETFSLTEFENLSNQYNGLVKLNNRYLKVNPTDLYNIDFQTNFIPINPTQNDLMHFILSGDIEKLDIGVNDKLSELIDNLFDFNDVEVPDSLHGELREYQKVGFSWLYQNMKTGFGSILADDMGLGKTIQVLTTILYLKENDLIEGNVLIIAPTSLLTNWQMEIEKFTPTLTSHIYHGLGRELSDESADVILTSYGMVRQDFDILNDLDIFLCVVDEAQNIKNPSTKQTKAIKALEAKHRMALSGTPIENRLSEYWSIFDFINKGYLYNLRIFNEKFIKPIENEHDEEALEVFRKITSPFILRRHKNDKNIIKDLPDKIVNDIYCNLTVKQAAMYEETLNVLLRDVEQSEGIARKGLVLKLITSLKQICNHPAQFSNSENMSIDESGKMEVLISILENILENNEKVIIFSQYVKMGEILKKLIGSEFNEEVLFFHGQLSRKKRDEIVDSFQNNAENKIMVLSLKAGGTGLNLTAAQNVIHYDLWWNPAVENQATDRAYRIGQENNVMVYRFITRGTFEERINQILMEKIELAEIAIDSSESFITEMSNDDLNEMLKLRRFE